MNTNKQLHEFQESHVWCRSDGLRIHDLCYTCAVNSLKARDDIKSVQENLGHATASFTLSTYAHATPGMKRESENRMEHIINPYFDYLITG